VFHHEWCVDKFTILFNKKLEIIVSAYGFLLLNSGLAQFPGPDQFIGKELLSD
jgi:hypothetical protein